MMDLRQFVDSKYPKMGGGVNAPPVILLATMLRAGLTGNIACGKSYVSKVFAELGAHVIDADLVVHELLASGTKTYDKIVHAFEERILDQNGEINRKRLAQIVFFDADKRLLLNKLTHPEVGGEILRRIRDLEQSSSSGIIIVDAALMAETGNYKMYHCLIVVACEPALQISRLMSRDGLTKKEARARIESQMPIEEKRKLGDYVIDTSGTLKQTRDQAEAVYRNLLIRQLSMKESP
jgi:dephospho-CoA kinase